MTERTSALAVAALVLLAACSDDANDATTTGVSSEVTSGAVIVTQPSTPNPPATAEPTATDGPTATAATTTQAPAAQPSVGDPIVDLEQVGVFRSPVDLTFRADDPALYIVEQGGRVIRFADGTQVVAADISDRVAFEGERGLLGLAFSLDGATAYLHYSDTDGDTTVSEMPVDADGLLQTDAERVIFTLPQPYSNHNGGDLAVDRAGMLLIALGDGGSGGDPERRASDPTNLWGTLLRIDPAPGDGQPYTIPADNPFADGDSEFGPGAPEVWAWGLRNPWKIAFDPIDGALWIADVGQNEVEEINRVSPDTATTAGRGHNFGWSAFEGTDPYNDDVAVTGNETAPVLTYRHNEGCSISGGAPYRGTAIAELAPAYVYSDFCSGVLWALDLAGGRNLTLLDGLSQVTAVRAGPDGELYVLDLNGEVQRLVQG